MDRVRVAFGWMAVMVAVFGWSLAAWAADAEGVATVPVVEVTEAPRIQVALLLDTSNSMDGLIGQAKSQLWKVVNEFATMKRGSVTAHLEVALYEYGNDGLPSKEGYIRLVVPMTRDLDKVSQELFALKTNGGSEYCGQVISVATRALEWSSDPNDLKTIFIAGNEPFTQGGVDYKEACKAAIGKGIVVNTIFCGNQKEGINTHWKTGADLADGTFMSIDQNHKVVHFAAPQDKEIARLNEELNKTYVPYGAKGEEGKKNQEDQDANAQVAGPGTVLARTAAKATGQYTNDAWDLVDAVRNNEVDLDEVKKEDLPEPMKEMNGEERKQYVEENAKRRAEIQQQIKNLSAGRAAHIAEQEKAAAEAGEETLDSAVVKSVEVQAERMGYEKE